MSNIIKHNRQIRSARIVRVNPRLTEPETAAVLEEAMEELYVQEQPAVEHAVHAAPVHESNPEHLKEMFQRGWEEGRQQAERDLAQRYERAFTEMDARMETLAGSMQAAMEDFLRSSERAVIALALQIAERIVRREIHCDDEGVIQQAKAAMRRVVGVDRVKLLVHPDDEEILKKHRTILMKASDSIGEIVIEADEKIERGGCVIESDAGNIDARIATQMKKIEESLLALTKDHGTDSRHTA